MYNVTDKEFKKYGRVLDFDTKEIVEALEKIEIPENGCAYRAGISELETLSSAKMIKTEFFGGLETQIGYCAGHSNSHKAFEWHTCSEIVVAATDFALVLGTIFEFDEDGRYNTQNTKVFYVKKGQAIEMYPTTLHHCPCEVTKDGFCCAVGLLKGTNTALEEKTESKLLTHKNKWFIVREDDEELIEKGMIPKIYGERIEVNY